MAMRIINSCIFIVLAIQFALSTALISSPDVKPLSPKAFSELKEATIKGLGLQADDVKITGFDLRDMLVGRSVAYEFDVEIDKMVLPLKLMEDVKRWENADVPIFKVAKDSVKPEVENGLVEKRGLDDGLPVLAPFQLAGPMELWIQDAKDVRLSLPHDVDAGVLKKVLIADGAVVTVTGARSVSLRQPVELPLPFNHSQNGFPSGLLSLADHLRQVSRSQGEPLISLRIVGPTSLSSPTSSSSSSSNRLKLKRLAPGLVELSSASKMKTIETDSNIDLQEDVPTLLTPDGSATLWPLTSINGSNSNLLGFETLLSSILSSKVHAKGSFKLIKAHVSAQTFVKLRFGVEKKLQEADGSDWSGFPDWRTKPESVKMHFEVLGKIDGDKVVPERIMQFNPVEIEDSVAPQFITGNVTMSKIPLLLPPPNPFTL